VLSVGFLVLLPNTSINAASYYSGLAFFMALFQMVAWLPVDPAASPKETLRRIAPIALTAAATSTLRQNYQAAVGAALLFSYGAWLYRTRRLPARWQVGREAIFALALTGLFVVPWLVLLYRSNDTFLFPIM